MTFNIDNILNMFFSEIGGVDLYYLLLSCIIITVVFYSVSKDFIK